MSSSNKKIAGAIKKFAEFSARNAVNKKYLIMLHETEIPEAVKKMAQNAEKKN